MSKQITQLFDVQDGKRYFILQVEKNGTIHTGIAKATVRTRGHPLVTNLDIEFVTENTSGDLTPGYFQEMNYIAELDD